MTIDLTGRSDDQVRYRLQALKGETIVWCRRVRHGA